MKRELGYQRSAGEVKLIRRTHMVGFDTTTTAFELRGLLRQVRAGCTVDEVIDEGGLITIEFHEEKMVPAGVT